MIKYRFFLDFAKEEAWLREMARQGWELTGVSFGYHFRQTEPQDAVIRIDFRQFTGQDEYLNYRTLFEDSGWQHIAGSLKSGVQYFKRVRSGSNLSAPGGPGEAGADDSQPEDIFSDQLSRAERYRRISRFWLTMALVFLVILLALGLTGASDLRALVQPSRFYLTPGLWERSGEAFWSAFWFETPFALFRALLLYSFPVSLVLYFTFAIKSYRLYEKEKNHVSAA